MTKSKTRYKEKNVATKTTSLKCKMLGNERDLYILWKKEFPK